MSDHQTTPDNPPTSDLAADIECAIGLNTGGGGAGGVYAARDAVLAAISNQSAANVPGATTEQLPADVLKLLTTRHYLSTACETGRLLDGAIIRNPDRGDLPEWRDRMHQRCRLNQKFTGELCSCPCHPQAG
ncbi:hypothetical protein OH791_33595 [Streptomyces anulatus]|uniref:hypothetical protein n=1 Tax=Streptomyces anulatus TaxID=1892 RepID=UPI00386552A0|nr:hypothetical protein OH791_33595 [Streptomyces anulatus]